MPHQKVQSFYPRIQFPEVCLCVQLSHIRKYFHLSAMNESTRQGSLTSLLWKF